MKSLGSQLPSILLQRSRQLHDLNQLLLELLPLELHLHIQVAGLHRQLLILEADSPVWAAKARYLTHEISTQLSRKTGLTIKSVKVNVRPATTANKRVSRKKPYISKSSAHQLETLAGTITHPRLARSLAKLAKRGQ